MDSSSSSRSCSLEQQFPEQIAALLAPSPPHSAQEYYAELIQAVKCNGLKVSYSSKHGKGVFVNKDFIEGELVLKDKILVGAQHTANKVDCLVCSYCFRFIGSIELQIGRRLYLQSLGFAGSVENSDEFHNDHVESSASRSMNSSLPPKGVLESLMSGDLSLPFTSQFALPPVTSCPGGCGEEHYCSQVCAETDWESYHSLLCTGPNTGPSQRSALLKFIEHANGTNDIFLVAAKAISFTILRYKKLKSLQVEEKERHHYLGKTDSSSFALLLEAWKPLSMGFKRTWWDCIDLPSDIDSCDETSFRKEIRDLTFTSLQLLKDAIFDFDCAPLFSLEVYGNIIGMFELNNLDLVVASPVEDYFIYLSDLPDVEKEDAERRTDTFLDALGDDYSVCCQGTAFFPIQSCMNHSCCPNAKAFKRDEDKDGNAIIIALQPICSGEETTISYIDESLPYEERQALLADYGFTCTCRRCIEERPN